MRSQRLLVLAAFGLLAGACAGDTESPTAVPEQAPVVESAAIPVHPFFQLNFSTTSVLLQAAEEFTVPSPAKVVITSPFAAFATLGPPRVIKVEYLGAGAPTGWLTGNVELKSAFRADLNVRAVVGLPLGAYHARVTLTLLGVANYVVNVTFVSGLYYIDCANSDTDWDFTGLWNLTAGNNTMNPRGATPLPEEGSGYFWYGSPATGDFDFGNNSGTATGPYFMLPAAAANPVVHLRTWFEIEYDVSPFNYDFMEVWLVDEDDEDEEFLGRINGSPYFVGNGNSFGSGGPWVDFEVPIPLSLTGDDWQIRLLFRTNDGAYNDYRGWGVDCITVTEGAPPTGPSMAGRAAGIDRSLLTGERPRWLTPSLELPVVRRK